MAAKIAENTVLNEKVEKALEYISRFQGVVVALSAGVDSSLVAALARKSLGEKAIAVTALSESLPPGELEVAKKTAAQLGMKHFIVHTNELEDPNYVRNSGDRCYHCKATTYRELRSLANRHRLSSILDGTHVDDLQDDRPGLNAAREADVKSPLLYAGFSKNDVREAAKMFGLEVWDKPAMPCLSSRITHGQKVTNDRLMLIGQAETFIKNLTGVKVLRVRYDNNEARIEVLPDERRLFFDENIFDRVDEYLRKLGFSHVTLDLHGYREKKKVKVHPEISLPMLS